MPGPQETRLIQALQGARPGNVDSRSYEWAKCADILRTVSGQLDQAEMPVVAGEAGEKTASAMNSAFKAAAAGMKERETKLRAGSQALASAQAALDEAKSAHEALGAESAPPTYTPSEDPGSEAGIKHHNDYLAKAAAHQSEVEHRERVSREHADKLDQALRHSSDTMREIHGEKEGGDDGGRRGPVGGGGGGSSSAGGHGGGAPAVHLAGPNPGSGPGYHPGHHHNPGHGGHTTNPPGPGVTYPPGGGTQEPGGGGTIGTIPVGTSPGGGLPGTGLVAGATAGGVGAGLLGAGLTSGGLRGILSSGGASPSTAQSAVRGIGTTSRAAGATTLGRSGVSSASTTSGTGASGRSAGGAAGANRSGSSTRGGKAGGRSGGRSGGAAGGGRGGRRKDDDKSGKHDVFDVDEDWVDDEGAAPGVLD
ncbi:hypothetical protein ABLE68_13580 [Nocardioides sp. CN2-186]|uniref:hypothetical protein n=1 Tax=Nocardioides tweenelious TaxID=3156607 RepID=UPI0032B60395